MDKIQIYTDGSCLNNPGVGAYAICIIKNNDEEIFTDFEDHTTNNRMEIKAVLLALEKSKNMLNVEIFSDSNYVVKGFNEWMHTWNKNGWKNSKKETVENLDLWQELYKYYHICKFHKIIWIKAHNNHKYNELVNDKAQDTARKRLNELKNLKN